MPVYDVYGKVTALKYLGQYEADSPEDAAAMAVNSDEMDVHICDCDDEIEEAEIEALMVGVVDDEDQQARH